MYKRKIFHSFDGQHHCHRRLSVHDYTSDSLGIESFSNNDKYLPKPYKLLRSYSVDEKTIDGYVQNFKAGIEFEWNLVLKEVKRWKQQAALNVLLTD
ncbi:hypothetical protein BDZ45DRAFT_497740 [Acephala macrosclerotiorum]|nr:hypothetical protein BDZ45DRAFT_497740 [Acephala macrosclerotiorum]